MTPDMDDPHPEPGNVPPIPAVGQQAKHGLHAALGSIAAGVVGFCVPVLGMAASCAGIWLGMIAVRRGRAANDRANLVCGIIGTALSALGIVFWVMAVLFESYR
jgi:hypothetical protein